MNQLIKNQDLYSDLQKSFKKKFGGFGFEIENMNVHIRGIQAQGRISVRCPEGIMSITTEGQYGMDVILVLVNQASDVASQWLFYRYRWVEKKKLN